MHPRPNTETCQGRCAFEWVEAPGGWFVMGGGKAPNENPPHRVHVAPFRIARHPVTREQYAAFLAATGHDEPRDFANPAFAHPRMPIVGISWHDAVAFCAWASAGDLPPLRLPTEAEWEHAARGGRAAVPYAFGDGPPETLPDYAERWQTGPEPVDAYPSMHPWGLQGMGENIHEWCADWYAADYYDHSPPDQPTGPPTGRKRASRGGAWRHAVKVSRVTARSALLPDARYTDYGMRVVTTAWSSSS